MKLNFKKAGARILLVVFFSSLLIISCEKDDEFVQSDAKTKNQEFFKHQKTGGDEFKSYILECLAQADDSLSFTGDFVKTYGLPQWDCGMHFGNEEYNSLIIPIYDQENKAISALYYLHYQNQYIESFILMNDVDDIAYERSKGLIQYFEKTLNLETSNKEFDIVIIPKGETSSNSTKSAIGIDYLICTNNWGTASMGDVTYYWSEEDCAIETEYYFEEHHSSGGWATSNGGNYSTNTSYGGGSSGSSNSNLKDPEPYPGYNPAPPVETTQEFDDSKAGCLYTEMRSTGHEMLPSTLTDELLRGLEYPSSKINVTYKLTTELPDSKKGRCHSIVITNRIQGLVSGTIEILINQNVLDSRNFLQTGNTIFHETLHAYMKGMLYEAGLQVDISNFDFKETYSLYKTQYPQNQVDHAIWVDNYRDILKKNLESLFNNAPSEAQNSILNAINGYSGNLGDLDFLFTYMANSGLEGVGNNTFTVTPEERSILESDILSQINKNCPY
ncbi:hypothetical protein [Labilibaculum euxinus]